MSLSSQSIVRIFKECLLAEKGSSLIVAAPDREVFVQDLKPRIQGLEYVRVEYPKGQDQTRRLVSFTVKDPGEPFYYQGETFHLQTDPQDRLDLVACSGNKSLRISDIDEIVRFANLCQQAIARRVAQRKKREKINALKTQAVMAQVRQLVQSEGLEYTAENNRRGIKLFLNLNDKDCLELEVPFNGFEQALPRVREAVQALRGMAAFKLRFRLHQMSGSYRWRHMQWTKVPP